MKSTLSKFPLLAVLFLGLPTAAQAHLVGGNGFVSGVTHPLFGIDHLLAMVAVGALSVLVATHGRFKVPATFVGFMLLGGLLSLTGFQLPGVEGGVALSVLFFGGLIAFAKKLTTPVAMILVAFFATFHGFAHGLEMPQMAHPALYALGFVLSTSLLHVAGVLVGHYAQKKAWSLNFLRYSGAALSVVGVYLLIGM